MQTGDFANSSTRSPVPRAFTSHVRMPNVFMSRLGLLAGKKPRFRSATSSRNLRRTFGWILCLLLLCSRATAAAIAPILPPPIPINKEAGRGGHLIINLRFQSGQILPCIVDTGSSATILDRSCESELGERVSPVIVWTHFGRQEGGIYPAPKLYVGEVALKTYHQVLTYDFKKIPAFARAGVMGILGMDCLQHYCLQLDFQSGWVHFLPLDGSPRVGLGDEFPLTFSVTRAANDVPSMRLLFMKHTGIFGTEANVMIEQCILNAGRVTAYRALAFHG
jgi:hypothetical protein